MKTLLEKHNHYEQLIAERENEYVKNTFTNPPIELYSVSPRGQIRKLSFTYLSYYRGKYFGFNKRPTKVDVELIKEYHESSPELLPEKIFWHWKEGNSSSAIKMTEIKNYFSKEQAEIKSLEIIEKHNEELVLLENDHSRCGYCHKVFPNSTMIKSNIIGRGRKQTWNSWKGIYEDKACVTQTVMSFCSRKCAGNEQMSREG